MRRGAVEGHDQRHDAVDAFDALLFGRLPVVGRVGFDTDIAVHPIGSSAESNQSRGRFA